MSGIGAIVTFDGSAVGRETMDSLVAAAPHRSLGGVEHWHGPGASIARLAANRTAGGGPPAALAETAGQVVVADARIDNRVELVLFLTRRGYLAASEPARTSDTEIILAAHRCWGDLAPRRLIGDFAYLLWDPRRRRLLAARDAMGMRPLFHRIEPGRRAIVASEIKQLLAVPAVPCAVDEQALVATLAGPYLPVDRTVYAGIAQLAPAHLLVVDAAGSHVRRFWEPHSERRVDASDEATTVAAFRHIFARAVGDRLDPERPTGLSLSGGMDSGSIAAMAGWLTRQGTPGSLRTYSWAPSELPDSDERAVSSLLTDAYGLPAISVPGDDAWPLAAYPEHGPDRDDPFVWPYQVLQDRTGEAAATDGAGTLLSGDRGDELVGDWVFDDLGPLRAGHPLASLTELRRRAAQERSSFARTTARALLEPWRARRRPGERIAPWIPEPLARRTHLDDLVAAMRRPPTHADHPRSMRYQRLFMAQGARIATHNERTKARHGLAHADPYADRRLIEFVLAVPQWHVQRRGDPKRLLRRAVHDVVPPPARSRLGKQIPRGLFDRGLRHRGVETARSLLTDSIAASNGWLDEEVARREYARYVATGDATHDFWWPLSVEWWLRRWWQ
jgi:asparagine synthase (glutamine-hydrolysing)